MVMNTDQAFAKACRLLDKATKIWSAKDKKNYPYAEWCFDQAVEIRDTYFDNKKELTEDLCPF